jgi:hypothetical protein
MTTAFIRLSLVRAAAADMVRVYREGKNAAMRVRRPGRRTLKRWSFDMMLPIIRPAVALMLLTFGVWLWMAVARLRYGMANGLDPERMKTPRDTAEALPPPVNYAAYNLANLTELPVVFYAICIILMVLRRSDPVDVILAWVFVAARLVHSLIHCSVNIVRLRSLAYLVSSVCLWAMLVRLALLVFLAPE